MHISRAVILAVLLLPAGGSLAPSTITQNRCTTAGLITGGSRLRQTIGCAPSLQNQTVGGTDVSGSQVQAAAFNVAAGSALAVWVVNDGGVTTVSVADTAGNTFTQGTQCTVTTTQSGVWFWAKNVTGNAADVVTANFGASRARVEIMVYQISGASLTAPKDFNGGCATATSGNTATSLAFTTTAANEILLAGIMTGSQTQVYTAGSGYNLGMATALNTGTTEFKVVSAIQTSVTASIAFTLGSHWLISILTIK